MSSSGPEVRSVDGNLSLGVRSKNENNSHSEVVPYKVEVVVQAEIILQG